MPIVTGPSRTAPSPGVTSFDVNNPPPHLKGLLALNPKLAQHLVTDPGLRAFLELNRDRLVDFTPQSPPDGALRDDLKLDTWCHATSIVPPSERDEEYIVVVARGSVYPKNGEIEIPLQSGGAGKADGRILFVGKTRDYLHTFVDDNDPHYPGAGAVTLEMPVFGARGERVELSYCRFKPDAQGRAHPSRAAWPNSFRGVFGGYAGRDQALTLRGGATPHLHCPP